MKPQLFTSLFFSLFLNIQTVQSQIVINEFSAANHQQFFDNYGEDEDWIELYNSSDNAINIGGYHLSDKLNNPSKWKVPEGTIIPANGFLIIWASNRDENSTGVLHTNFKITQTKNSEAVVLSNPDGNIIDSHQLETPNQTNHSWARISDGDAKWGIQKNPTPGTSNIDVLFPYSSRPKLFPKAGFYDEFVEVKIENIDPDVTIFYTTDGSIPNTNSSLYSGPFTIQNTSTVKAVAISSNPEIPNSFIDFKTYFIDESHSIPVVSLTGIELQELLEGTISEPTGTFELFDNNGSRVAFATGEFNKHGHDSWAYDQRGIDYITRDEFGENYTLKYKIFAHSSNRTKFQRIILKAAANDNYPFENGGAHIRDAFVHTLSKKAGLHLDERTYEPCVLYINGKYWGVYEMREKVDDPDYTGHYYKQGKKWIDFIKTWGATWEEYGSRSDWDQLREFIANNDMSVQENYEVVENQLDIESLIDYVILHSYNVSSDWLNWNTAWWRGRKSSGDMQKWRYILWDEDATFGHFLNYSDIPDRSPLAAPCNPEIIPSNIDNQGHIAIFNALSENPDFFAKYISRYADLTNAYFNCDFMIDLLDKMIARIEPEMPRHISRWGGSMNEWQENIQKLKDFINTRCSVISAGIVDCYEDKGITGPFEITVNIEPQNAGKVLFNTMAETSYPWKISYFGGIELNLRPIAHMGYEFDHWEVANHEFSQDQLSDALSLNLIANDEITAVFHYPCNDIYELKIDSSMTSFSFSWTNPEEVSGNSVYYKLKSDTVWNSYSIPQPTTTIENLEACSEYEIMLFNSCPNGQGITLIGINSFSLKTKCKNDINYGSNIISVDVFPNPFENNVNIDLELSEAEKITIELSDVTGQLIQSQLFDVTQAGLNQLILETTNLSQGVYLLKIVSTNGLAVKRIIKGM